MVLLPANMLYDNLSLISNKRI